jgi:hypothetical protein
MRQPFLSIPAFGLAALICASASADTLRCRSFNGNVTCAGSGGASCQTVNGRTVCTSGRGDVVQSFGATTPPGAEDRTPGGLPDAAPPGDDGPEAGLDAGPAPAPRGQPRLSIRRTDPFGAPLSLERHGREVHLRNGSVSIDIE